MIFKRPIKEIMTKDLITLSPDDRLTKAKELFDKYGMHHIPVVEFRKIVGLLSKSDFLLYVNSISDGGGVEVKEDQKLSFSKVKQVMVTRLGKLEPDDRIEVAIDIFLKNYFHCLPVVEGDELLGLVTPFDILKFVSKEIQ
ncbi:MAG: CBS domain-containing protein [Saprospiraceae bacterium]|nr:CBS domain-containing protein [Saprospiraceae bacterium]